MNIRENAHHEFAAIPSAGDRLRNRFTIPLHVTNGVGDEFPNASKSRFRRASQLKCISKFNFNR